MHANNSTLQKSSQKPAVSEEFASLIAGSVFIFSSNKQSHSCFTDHFCFIFFLVPYAWLECFVCLGKLTRGFSFSLTLMILWHPEESFLAFSLNRCFFFLSFFCFFFSLWVEAIVFIHFLEFEFISLLLGVCCDLGETHFSDVEFSFRILFICSKFSAISNWDFQFWVLSFCWSRISLKWFLCQLIYKLNTSST